MCYFVEHRVGIVVTTTRATLPTTDNFITLFSTKEHTYLANLFHMITSYLGFFFESMLNAQCILLYIAP